MTRALVLPMALPEAKPRPRAARRGRLYDAGDHFRAYRCRQGHRFELMVTDAEDAARRLRRTRPCPVCNGLDTTSPTEDGAVYHDVDARSEDARRLDNDVEMQALKRWAEALPVAGEEDPS